MDIEHIQEFVILAETCSFQETAAQTFISQSSLTKHIQNIEKELGIPLFDRTTRTVNLNKYGAEFYKYAKQITQISQNYKFALHNMQREESGRLTVAFQSRIGQYGVIQLLFRFQEEFPQYPLKMIENPQVVRFLAAGESDFVFTSEKAPQDNDIAEFICRTNNMVAAVPANHPLAQEARISIQQLKNEKMILHEDSPQNISWETRTLRRLCTEAGFDINEVMTVSFTSNLVRMVGQGMGIGVINRMQATDDDHGRVIFVDIAPEIPFHIKLLYHKQIENETAAAAFIKFVKSEIEKRGYLC